MMAESEEDDSMMTPLMASSTRPAGSQRRKLAVGFVLVSLTLERLAYFALAANFFLFLNKGSVGPRDASAWGTAQAMDAVLVFSGVSHLSSFFAGWLADTVTGRFRAVLLGFLLYITGYSLLTALAAHALPVCHFDLGANRTFAFLSNDHEEELQQERQDMNPCSEVVYPIAVLVGLGVGAIKANMAPFGAEQTVESATLGAFTDRRSFFTWYYWCVNVGGLLGIGILCFVEQNVTNGFPWSYLMATCCLVVASLLLILPGGCCGLYRDVKPSSSFSRGVGYSSPLLSSSSTAIGGSSSVASSTASSSAVTLIFRVFCDAFQNRRISTQCTTPVSDFGDFPGRVNGSSGRRSNHGFGSPLARPPHRPESFLDWAKVEFGGSFSEDAVEQVKALGPILVVFSALLPHWLVYFQIETTFQAQGLHMRLDIGDVPRVGGNHSSGGASTIMFTSSFQVPAAWLILFDVIFLLVLIPLLNNVLYPLCSRRGFSPSLLTRMCIGMTFGLLAAVSAGVLEMERIRLWNQSNSTHITQIVSGTEFEAVDLSILWQLPQYSLIGLAEAFASVAGLEYAYSASPRSAQNLIMGLFCAFQGLASFFALGLLNLCRAFSWVSTSRVRSLEEDRLDLYFFLLAGIQAVTVVVFAVSVKLRLCLWGWTSKTNSNKTSIVRSDRNVRSYSTEHSVST